MDLIRSKQTTPRQFWKPGHLANVWVRSDLPQYPVMAARAQKASTDEYRQDEGGIWVPFGWLR